MIKHSALMLVVVGVATLAACGKKKGGASQSDKPIDVAAVNAAIPADWKAKIAFEPHVFKGHFDDDSVTAIGPKGWKPGFLSDEVDPPDGDTVFGFGTSMRVGATCGGECKSHTADEYAKLANESFFDNVGKHTPPPTISKDEKLPNRRTMISTDTHSDGNVNNTTVMVSWWADGGERFYFCDVTLAPESAALAPVFEKACAAIAQ